MNEPFFYETQKFRQKWVLYILYVLWVGILFLAVLLLLERRAGPLIAVLLFGFVSIFVWGFTNLKLETRVSADAISYRFFPLQWKLREVQRTEIGQLEIVSYDPLSQYGGWGIRMGKNGWAYTVSGHTGLLISRAGKKDILLGTCKSQELKLFLIQHGYPV